MIARKLEIMGILNVTPDSFSDGGRFADEAGAVNAALDMLHNGADIVDVGGEATGPMSKPVTAAEELSRTIPVICGILARNVHARISIDTYKASVVQEALCAGAVIVNDVTAFRGDPKIAEVVARAQCDAVLMYAKDSSLRTTRDPVQYDDVIATILAFLEERISYAVSQGVAKEKIIIDPGMGAFVSGDPRYSYEIIRRLPELRRLGCRILIGASRKSFLPGAVHDRLIPTIAINTIAALSGADILRVHDVGEHIKLRATLDRYVK